MFFFFFSFWCCYFCIFYRYWSDACLFVV